MSAIHILQAASRDCAHIADLDGSSCVQDLMRGYYKDTPYKAHSPRQKRLLLADARDGKIHGYPPDQYKFKFRKEVAA